MNFISNGSILPHNTFNQKSRRKCYESDILAKMISKVSFSVAEQSTRQMLMGANFKFTSDLLEVVSCNTFILSKCTSKCEIKSIDPDTTVNYSIIIPGHALPELSKILLDGESGKVELYVSRKHAIVKKENVIFFTRTANK